MQMTGSYYYYYIIVAHKQLSIEFKFINKKTISLQFK